jgi:hypothetical protein
MGTPPFSVLVGRQVTDVVGPGEMQDQHGDAVQAADEYHDRGNTA